MSLGRGSLKTYTDQDAETEFLSGGGELGALIRQKDWAGTPLGPVRDWPQALKTSVRIMLTSRQPMFVWWGDQLTNLYNDAYCSILGGKHPQALGQPAAVVWREIWDQVRPRAESAIFENKGTYDEALMLIMERNGYPEETYYTFSYSPVPSDDGVTGGIFCANSNDTPRIIGERQLALLRDLAARTVDARTVADACERSAQSLETNSRDLPFALIYLFDQDRSHVVLAGRSGMAKGHSAAPDSALVADPHIWPFEEVMRKNTGILIPNLGASFGELPRGAWDAPPQQAIALPIAPSGQSGRGGILIAGLNPYRLFDDNYRWFLNLAAGQIGSAIGNAYAYEEERRRLEQLAELDRSKTAFFSNVSHEFRTPLTLMLGTLEEILAKRTVENPSADRELVDVAHRNGLRLLKLVNSLLDFSRIEGGRMQAHLEACDLAELTRGLVSNFHSAIEKAGLRFIVDCPPLPGHAYVDRDMWEKIILNLVSNALKFTFEGEIRVGLHAVENSSQLELTVEDTGIGIPQDQIPRLFERFHRVEGARGRTHEGTGIGLALVQELVKLHGGSVHVSSEVDRGSLFRIRIPMGQAHILPVQTAAPASLNSSSRADGYVEEALFWLPNEKADIAIETPQAGGRSRILLADDNADMREYVQRLLTPQYEVAAVANGQLAWECALEHRPDLILSDVMMPVLDGFGLLNAIRSHASTNTVPVILLSARAGEEARVEGLDAGADDYLVKPFTARELIARVGVHLELSRVRNRALQALRENEERLRIATTAAALGVYEWNLRTDRTVWQNERMFEIFGHPAGQLPPTKTEFLTRYLHPEEVEHFEDRITAAMREGRPYHSSFRIIRSDGAVRWVEAFGKFEQGADGSNQLFGVLADITEQRQVEEALREREERFRIVANSAPVMIWMTDADQRYEWCNESWLSFTGRSMEQEAGTQWAERVHPEDVKGHLEAYLQNVKARREFQIEYRMRRHDGAWRWVLNHGIPRADLNGGFAGYIGSCVDLTERKRAEEALTTINAELKRANEDLNQFAFSASHDLQEPLRNVSIYGQLLQKRYASKLDGQAREFLEYLVESSMRMQELLRALLSYTQATHGELVAASTDANVALKNTLFGLKTAIIEAQAEILAEPLPSVAMAEVHLSQLFQNLIGNAVKYHGPEPPVVRIRAARQGSEWCFTVQDNGIGISPEYHKRIFGIFRRLHGASAYSGTGIGLAITQKIVERYGGRIWVESELGNGAAFHFTLPACDAY